MDYAGSFTPTNPGSDYPVKYGQLVAQLTLDSDKVDSAAIGYSFGYKRNTTAGLNVGYYGGVIISGGVLKTIADGTVALTGATTNYVERTTTGVVSKNTAGFTAGKIPMFTAVTAGGAITTVTDKRQRNVFGDLSVLGNITGPANFSDLITANAGIIIPTGQSVTGAGTAAISGFATLSMGAGTVSLPSIYFSTDTSSGIYRIGANNIGVAVSGVKVLDIGGVSTLLIGRLGVASYFAANNASPQAPGSGYGTPTGNAVQGSFAASTITLPNLAAEVAQLVIDQKKTGLIAA